MQILATEFGDETFIVAALMAMRHEKLVVFGGAITALVIMTVLSTALGFIVPNLISRHTTGVLAGCLYTFFGLRLMYIAYFSGTSSEANEVRLAFYHVVFSALAGSVVRLLYWSKSHCCTAAITVRACAREWIWHVWCAMHQIMKGSQLEMIGPHVHHCRKRFMKWRRSLERRRSLAQGASCGGVARLSFSRRSC